MQKLGLLVLLFSGCVTPYGPMGLLGGYRDRRVAEDTYQVEVAGNAFTSVWTLEEYFHQRANELCGSAYDFQTERDSYFTPGAVVADSDTRFRGNRAETRTTYRQQPGMTRASVNGYVKCKPVVRSSSGRSLALDLVDPPSDMQAAAPVAEKPAELATPTLTAEEREALGKIQR